MDKKKDIFSMVSDAFDKFKNIISNVGQKAKEIVKAAVDKGLDFFEGFDITKPYVQKIRKKAVKSDDFLDYPDQKITKQSDSEAENLLKSKKILFDIDEGIVSLVEDRVGQYLIIYIRIPEGKIPVFFSSSFVNAKEWIARNGIQKANHLLLKRISRVNITVDYIKVAYVTKKGKKGYSEEKERVINKDIYEFSRSVHNMRYTDIASMLYSYVKEEFMGKEFTAEGSGPGGRPYNIQDFRLFVE